eukprot:TRINITY_DN4508_c0_g1_i1.p5 TRINITY_DN4508_c0_g1~~TRINITY_DN4508_c0_g1_i1.p5  ORF type:complete len:103 (+),score=17.22 TRINITY_DN4508_c0_g1_i1:689-997(+)
MATAGQEREGLYDKLAAAGFVYLTAAGSYFDRTRLATALASTCAFFKAVYAPAVVQGFLHEAGQHPPADRRGAPTCQGRVPCDGRSSKDRRRRRGPRRLGPG